jgi:hypothetical protein
VVEQHAPDYRCAKGSRCPTHLSLLNLPVDLMHRAAPEAQPQPGGKRGERFVALVVALAVLAFGAVAGLSW